MSVPSSELWKRAQAGGRSEADMQRAEAWMAEANVQREGMGIPEAGLGAESDAIRYGDFTHRKPMWLVALETSPLPRVPTM